MVDTLKREAAAAAQWVAAACAAATFVLIVVVYLLGAGGIFGHDAATISNLQQRIDALTTQVSRLSDKMDASPRPDQLQEIIRHLSAQDGRMDAQDTRLREQGERMAGFQERLGSIDAASRAQLPTRR